MGAEQRFGGAYLVRYHIEGVRVHCLCVDVPNDQRRFSTDGTDVCS